MTTMVDYGYVWVCTDCYFAHHYGAHEVTADEADKYNPAGWYAGESDTPADCEPLSELGELEASDATCSDHYYGQDCAVDEDEDSDTYGENLEPCAQCGGSDDENGIEEFSSRPCQGCGSHLGGSRYRLHLTKRGDEYDTYAAKCEAENLDAHSRHMWEVHGRPGGPLG